jgi:hypothetical protein
MAGVKSVRIVIDGQPATPGQVFRRWVVIGGIAGAGVAIALVAIFVAFILVAAAAGGALAGSIVGAVVGAVKAMLALGRRG